MCGPLCQDMTRGGTVLWCLDVLYLSLLLGFGFYWFKIYRSLVDLSASDVTWYNKGVTALTRPMHRLFLLSTNQTFSRSGGDQPFRNFGANYLLRWIYGSFACLWPVVEVEPFLHMSWVIIESPNPNAVEVNFLDTKNAIELEFSGGGWVIDKNKNSTWNDFVGVSLVGVSIKHFNLFAARAGDNENWLCMSWNIYGVIFVIYEHKVSKT